MEALAAAGKEVGEYVGNGLGETERPTAVSEDVDTVSADSDVSEEEEEEDSSENTKPLLIFYDCETSGLSINNEHIIEIAAKVVNPPCQL